MHVSEPKTARMVLLSAAGVTPKDRLAHVGIILSLLRWRLPKRKWEGEQILRRSGINYVMYVMSLLISFFELE